MVSTPRVSTDAAAFVTALFQSLEGFGLSQQWASYRFGMTTSQINGLKRDGSGTLNTFNRVWGGLPDPLAVDYLMNAIANQGWMTYLVRAIRILDAVQPQEATGQRQRKKSPCMAGLVRLWVSLHFANTDATIDTLAGIIQVDDVKYAIPDSFYLNPEILRVLPSAYQKDRLKPITRPINRFIFETWALFHLGFVPDVVNAEERMVTVGRDVYGIPDFCYEQEIPELFKIWVM